MFVRDSLPRLSDRSRRVANAVGVEIQFRPAREPLRLMLSVGLGKTLHFFVGRDAA